jgi:hypothetical protein
MPLPSTSEPPPTPKNVSAAITLTRRVVSERGLQRV